MTTPLSVKSDATARSPPLGYPFVVGSTVGFDVELESLQAVINTATLMAKSKHNMDKNFFRMAISF
jgi:hypothetical protein